MEHWWWQHSFLWSHTCSVQSGNLFAQANFIKLLTIIIDGVPAVMSTQAYYDSFSICDQHNSASTLSFQQANMCDGERPVFYNLYDKIVSTKYLAISVHKTHAHRNVWQQEIEFYAIFTAKIKTEKLLYSCLGCTPSGSCPCYCTYGLL